MLAINPESGFWLRFGAVVKRFDVLDHIEFRSVTPLRAPAPSEAAAVSDGDEDGEENDEGEEPDTNRAPKRRAPTEPPKDDAIAGAAAERWSSSIPLRSGSTAGAPHF